MPLLVALVLAFFSNLMSSMTHCGTGPAPVFYGSGYVESGDWWKYGAIISGDYHHLARYRWDLVEGYRSLGKQFLTQQAEVDRLVCPAS